MTRRPSRKTSNDHTRAPEVLDALERRELELDPTIDAWDQQSRETPRNYGLFLMYRDMGRIRTVAQLAATSPQTSVTVAASTKTDAAGKPEVRVEVGVQHDNIMRTLDAMVQRMSPEQISAGYQELTASAEEATRELDAALPAPPPQ